ncbi:MAG: hypothetical protein ACYC9K_01520 [Sulfuricaulis sp.]
MIEVKPKIRHETVCPYCQTRLLPSELLWQGIHVCVVSTCQSCKQRIIEDLRVSQALFTPFQIDLEAGKIFGPSEGRNWFGEPLLHSLKNPVTDVDLALKVEKLSEAENVVILNCIDFLYGHCLLKLLNVTQCLAADNGLGVVVIVQKFLRWLVPDGVAEVWTVDIPLASAQDYYPQISEIINAQCTRFTRIYVSKAHSHPYAFDIQDFTRTKRHEWNNEGTFRITYIWREDRLWDSADSWRRLALRMRLNGLLRWVLARLQNFKVRWLFSRLRARLPSVQFTVAGKGTMTTFPGWIQDCRVSSYTDAIELELCRIYSESRVVIGVHGSNMLLPSAHAGMVINLVPWDRSGNYAQDILYQETGHPSDVRISAFRYRYLPIDISVSSLADTVIAMITHAPSALRYFSAAHTS